MLIAYFSIAYAIFAGGFLFLVIFGQNTYFAGTVIETAADFATGGCFDVLLHGIEAVCGKAAAQTSESYLEYLCFTRNPLLGGVYLVMVAAIYYLYNLRVFGMLPTSVTPSWHIDPGTITASNLDEWTKRDPPGDRLYPVTDCRTCKFTKPARSKHCPVCNVCVARHDHHCGWVNNCIGAVNLRWFIAFLLANVVMMWHGAALAAAAVWGKLADIGYLDKRYVLPSTGEVVVLRYRPWYTFKLGLRLFPTPVALSIFLLVAGMVLLGFFVYHAWSASAGITKHDMLKQSRFKRALHDSQKAREGQASADSMAPLRVSYSRGFWRNWLEVLLPGSIAAGIPPASPVREHEPVQTKED